MSLTVIFIIVMVVLITVFDVWIIAKKGKTQSISAVIIRSSKQYPLITLLVGILLGHLYWSMKTIDIYGKCQ